MKPLTRRDFLVATSVATAGLAGVPDISRGQYLPTQKAFKMKFGFMTSMAQDKKLPELIELAKTYGYQGIEFRPEWKQAHGVELSMTQRQRKEARTRFADHGIDISAVSPGVKFLKGDNRDLLIDHAEKWKQMKAKFSV